MVDLKGKTILITGATDGIGKQTALELAGMGARILLHGRDPERLEVTRAQIQAATQSTTIALYLADFADLQQVKAMANVLLEKEERLDVLINNAGVYAQQPALSAQGYELSFAVNHLAHFLLTMLLLDAIQSSAPARIVVVSSASHSSCDIDYENLTHLQNFHGWDAYLRSKLANILFTYSLAEKIKGSDVTANCLHPGAVDTKMLNAAFPSMQGINLSQGAANSVYLASSPDVEGISGKYFRKLQPSEPSAISYDRDAQERLWHYSEQAVAAYLK